MTTTLPPDYTVLDSTKRVRYLHGQILGVDDFEQEHAYLAARDARLARLAIGYGVLEGLVLDITTDADPEVRVAPGTALTPAGELVSVAGEQCARINDYIAANLTDIRPRLDNDSAVLLAVVLSRRDFDTDEIPLPGEPCRSIDELRAASRRKDSFALEFRLAAPGRAEDEAVRDLAGFLRSTTLDPASTRTLDEYRLELDKYMAGQNADPGTVPSADFAAAILNYWVESLRPRLGAGTITDTGMAGGLEVLLGQVRVTLVADGDALIVSSDPTERPTIVRAQRTDLLHTRLIQELIANLALRVPMTGGTGGGPGELGEKGPRGDQGEVGLRGPVGEKGPPGDAGPAGGRGEQGLPGLTGIAGLPGADGRSGTDFIIAAARFGRDGSTEDRGAGHFAYRCKVAPEEIGLDRIIIRVYTDEPVHPELGVIVTGTAITPRGEIAVMTVLSTEEFRGDPAQEIVLQFIGTRRLGREESMILGGMFQITRFD